ncbi:MAG TPA: metallophosphoesterase, partial [Pirellulaceae bacterium]
MLDCLAPTAKDVVVTLGDYIDRGPSSPEVLDQLIALQRTVRLRPLMGNHERLLLLAVEEESELEFWLRSGGQPTLDAYGTMASIPDSHLEFMRGCLRFLDMETDFFVHANYLPALPLDQQSEFTLLWEHLTTHFPAPHVSGKRAIVGHTPQRSGDPFVRPHLVDLDTFCYGGGWLTG